VPAQLPPACVLLWVCSRGEISTCFQGCWLPGWPSLCRSCTWLWGAGVWAGGEAHMQLVGLPSEAMPVATAWTEGFGRPKTPCNFSHFVRGSPAGLHLHALMVAVIGKACHAAALAVHLCSCVVVGLDDQAYVPACECHTFSHTEPKLLSPSVRKLCLFLFCPHKLCLHLWWSSTMLLSCACCCTTWCVKYAGFPL